MREEWELGEGERECRYDWIGVKVSFSSGSVEGRVEVWSSVAHSSATWVDHKTDRHSLDPHHSSPSCAGLRPYPYPPSRCKYRPFHPLELNPVRCCRDSYLR
jgi:hypothetical protein